MLSINICALTTDRQMHSGRAQTTRLHLSMTHTSNLLFCAVRVTRWGGVLYRVTECVRLSWLKECDGNIYSLVSPYQIQV